METLRLLLKVFLIIMFLVVLVLSVALGFYGYRNFKDQKLKLVAKDVQIEKLGQSQMTLSKTAAEAEEVQRKLEAENAELKRSQEEIEKQKNVILKQVRSSVDSFEGFRMQANEEIAKLKKVAEILDVQKRNIETELASTQEKTAAEKASLEKQLSEVSQQLEKGKEVQDKLLASTQKKSRTAIVMETAKLHYNAGNLYFRNHDYQNAATEYKKALFYEPRDPDANYNLAVLADQVLGDRQLALKHFTRYLEINPGAKDALRIKEKILDLEIGERVEPLPPTKIEKEKPVFKEGEDPYANIVLAGDKK